MSEIMNKEDSPETALLWKKEQEELLKDWADIANCFRWLHEQSCFKFRSLNNQIALPVIILSTLTGTANFAIKSFVPESYMTIASAIIGLINIFCGVLTTIQTYYQYGELTESHNNASKLWSRLNRTIHIELAINPIKRRHPNDFLKYCIDEYNKLKENSPLIPMDVAATFRDKFQKMQNIFKPDMYDELGGTLMYIDYVSRNLSKQNLEKEQETKVVKVDIDNLSNSDTNSARENIHIELEKFSKEIINKLASPKIINRGEPKDLNVNDLKNI